MDLASEIKRLKLLSTENLKKALEETASLVPDTSASYNEYLLLLGRNKDLIRSHALGTIRSSGEVDMLGIDPPDAPTPNYLMESNRIRMSFFAFLDNL